MTGRQVAEIGQQATGCPIDPVLNFLALKWLVHIVWLLGRGKILRFSELQRALPGRVSAKVLSERLKQLEGIALIEREDKGISPPHVTYRLTTRGRAIDDFLVEIERFGRQLSLPDISQPRGRKAPAKRETM